MTLDDANLNLLIVEDNYLNIINVKGFKYLAVKKKHSLLRDNYLLELGYNIETMSKKKANTIIKTLRDILPGKTDMGIFPDIMKSIGITRKAKIEGAKSNSDIKFHATNNKNRSDNSKDKIRGGSYVECFDDGTLGAIITLKNHTGHFIISNYHVLMGDWKIGEKVFDDNYKKIGELFWGLYNNQYDAAIAKLTTKNICKGTKHYSFGELSEASFNSSCYQSVGKFGYLRNITLTSLNAIIKISNQIFVKQLMFENKKMKDGDSGSIIVKKDSNEVIGLYMGGDDNDIRVANNLFSLLNSPIESFVDEYNRLQPKIKYQSFY
jgi:hypothetical protein